MERSSCGMVVIWGWGVRDEGRKGKEAAERGSRGER